MSLFSSQELKGPSAAEIAPAAFMQIPTIGSFREYGEITAACDLISRLKAFEPAPWSEMFVSYGAFAMHQLVDTVIREVSREDTLLSIATWAMSERSARTIANWFPTG
jgi:hypothetical protein